MEERGVFGSAPRMSHSQGEGSFTLPKELSVNVFTVAAGAQCWSFQPARDDRRSQIAKPIW